MSMTQTNLSFDAQSGYEQLLNLSQNMRQLSREGNWSKLMEEQTRYVYQIEDMYRQGRLTGKEQGASTSIIDQLLEHTEEICARLLLRRDELGLLIRTEQRGPASHSSDA